MSSSIQLAYLVSTALFIFSLKWMNKPETARRGVARLTLRTAGGILCI